jgi:hypothetical protein
MLRLYRARLADDPDAIDPLLHDLDILHEDLSADERQEIRQFFDRYGSLIVEPYRQSPFDFGDPDFRERLQDCFSRASELRAVVGSPHFIFLNKALVGLLNLLIQLRPRIDTTRSVALLDDELERIGVPPVA